MLRTLALVLACVLVAAPPAMAKKRTAKRGHAHAVKSKKGKRGKALVRVQTAPPPTRVAAAEHRSAPPPPVVSTPAPTPPPAPAVAPSPPVEHGPLGPQASDDEVPGSRMKR